MRERWDDHAAEDLVQGYMADLCDSSPSSLPLDPERAREANLAVVEALAERSPSLLEQALLDARGAWTEPPARGYVPEDFDE